MSQQDYRDCKKLLRFEFSWPLAISSLFLLSDYSKKTHKILWEDPQNAQGDREKIIFTGSPFIILGGKIYNYQHGIDRKARDKRKRKEADEVGKHLVISLMYVFRYAHFAICLNDRTRRKP